MRARSWSAALCLALVPACLAGAPESVAPRPDRPAAGDLTIRWSYQALGSGGHFRLYRGAEPWSLAPIAELPARNGRQSQRLVDPGGRSRAAIYQLRYVDANGRETVLETLAWTPPTVSPGALPASGHDGVSALLRDAWRPPFGVRASWSRAEATARLAWCREAAVPPPEPPVATCQTILSML